MARAASRPPPPEAPPWATPVPKPEGRWARVTASHPGKRGRAASDASRGKCRAPQSYEALPAGDFGGGPPSRGPAPLWKGPVQRWPVPGGRRAQPGPRGGSARTGRRCPRSTARWRLTHGTGSSGHRCAAPSGPGQRGPAAQEVLDCGVPSRPRRPLQRERALHEEVPSSNTTVRYALGRARRALSGQKPGGVPTHPGPAVSRHQPGSLAAWAPPPVSGPGPRGAGWGTRKHGVHWELREPWGGGGVSPASRPGPGRRQRFHRLPRGWAPATEDRISVGY